MGFIQEFKAFALKGSVVDMAVGILIGVAFGKIVTSFVTDIVMPPIGYITGGVDFKDLKYVLKPASEGVAAVTINYGNFIQVTIDFLIITMAIFIAIKMINKLKSDDDNNNGTNLKIDNEETLSTGIKEGYNE